MVKTGKKASTIVLELKAAFWPFQEPVSEPNSTCGNGQLNRGSLKQTRRNSLSGDGHAPVEDHDMVSSLSHNKKARHIPGCLNVIANLLSRSNYVQSTEWSLHPQVPQMFLPSCKSICHSLEPQASTVHVFSPRPKGLGHGCSEHKLYQSHCLCLPSNGSPAQGDPKSGNATA